MRALLATPLGHLPRGPCPRAAPLRAGPPAAGSRARSGVCALASLAGPGPRPSPPGSPARPLCAAVRLRGLSLAPGPLPPHPLRCGLPAVALAPLRGGCGPAGGPAGAPSGPPALRRLRGRLAPPRGRWRPCGRLLRPAPGALCSARLRACAVRFAVGFVVPFGLSPAPPRPAAPAGGSGGPEARWVASPPAQRVGLLPPLWRAPPGGTSPPVHSPEIVNRVPALGASALTNASPAAGLLIVPASVKASLRLALGTPRASALTSPGREICPAGLTFPARCGKLVFRGPFRSFGGRSIAECPWTA